MVSVKTVENKQERISDTEKQYRPVLSKFQGIGLEDIEQAKLLNRVDSKYWFSTVLLEDMLNKLTSHYDILEINQRRIQRYKTRYFDTPKDEFYLHHHNGKGNRLKIRKRKYQDSGTEFLEIKRKNPKGKTSKTRISTLQEEEKLTRTDRLFLEQHTEISSTQLKERIGNEFKRITLVSKDKPERCTIDFDIHFINKEGRIELEQLVIIELKQEGHGSFSFLREVLNDHRIQPRGFSKYCIGRAMMQPELKQNRIKESLLLIKRLKSS